MSYRIIEKKYSDFNFSIEIKSFFDIHNVSIRSRSTAENLCSKHPFVRLSDKGSWLLYRSVDQTKYLKYVDKWKISGRAGELVAS